MDVVRIPPFSRHPSKHEQVAPIPLAGDSPEPPLPLRTRISEPYLHGRELLVRVALKIVRTSRALVSLVVASALGALLDLERCR